MDNKKPGIRLRHLEQQIQPEHKRDSSPNYANRKKIFEKIPTNRTQERGTADERVKEVKTFTSDNNTNREYEELIDSLKRKSMELELRDNMIKTLNHEIDELKKQLRLKDKEINKLNLEIERLGRVSKLSQEVTNDHQVFQSFRDQPEINSYAPPKQEPYKYTSDIGGQRKRFGSVTAGYSNNQEISLMNLDFKDYDQFESQREPEILSPFLALTNDRVSDKKDSNTFSSQITVKRQKESPSFSKKSEISSVNNISKSHNVSNSNNISRISNPFDDFNPIDSSGFQKKKLNQFDFSKGDDFFDKKVNTSQLDKFNIFGQAEPKLQLQSGNRSSKLAIEDSRQFKFEDFDAGDYNDLGFDFNR